MRFYTVVDLVNQLEQEKAAGKAGQLATRLVNVDAVTLDELGYLPFAESGGALQFHLFSKLRKRTSLHLTTNLVFSEWSKVFTDKKMTTAMRNRIMRVHRDRQRPLSLQTEDEISQLTLVNVGR